MISVNLKMLEYSSLLECRKNSCGISHCWSTLCLLLLCLFEHFFSQSCWCEKVVNSNTAPRTK